MRILLTSNTFAPSMDGPVFLPENTFADMEPDSARGIVLAGKGMYVDPKDDPTKLKQHTAPEPLVRVVSDALKAADKAPSK
jgi:hypothetical protein